MGFLGTVFQTTKEKRSTTKTTTFNTGYRNVTKHPAVPSSDGNSLHRFTMRIRSGVISNSSTSSSLSRSHMAWQCDIQHGGSSQEMMSWWQTMARLAFAIAMLTAVCEECHFLLQCEIRAGVSDAEWATVATRRQLVQFSQLWLCCVSQRTAAKKRSVTVCCGLLSAHPTAEEPSLLTCSGSHKRSLDSLRDLSLRRVHGSDDDISPQLQYLLVCHCMCLASV